MYGIGTVGVSLDRIFFFLEGVDRRSGTRTVPSTPLLEIFCKWKLSTDGY